jgi:hypothetical protein
MTILNAIQEELDDAAVNALITDTIMEVDELASHHSVGQVLSERTRKDEVPLGTLSRRF